MRAASLLALGALVGLLADRALRRWWSSRPRELVGLVDAVGDTKTVRLASLSEALGHAVFVKLEFTNPGGTAKDRAARQIVLDALPHLPRGATLVEGTSGSTGISLALLGAAHGLRTHIFIPSDMAREKMDLLRALGATLTVVPPAPFANPAHFCSAAQRLAQQEGASHFFADQFDNPSNWQAHYRTTAPELVAQMDGRIDAVLLGCGTGGMAAGVSTYLNEHLPSCAVCLVDVPGSSLLARVKAGVAFNAAEREGHRKRMQVDTIIEGIGLVGRVTRNFSHAHFDDAVACTDQEAVDMARYILRHEGFFIGSSSAAHLVGLVRYARTLQQPHQRLVTVLCDAGYRHLSKFWNPDFLAAQGLCVRDFDRHDLSFVA